MPSSFAALATFPVGGRPVQYYRLDALKDAGFDVARLPYSLKLLLENLLRHEDGATVKADDIKALAGWDPKAEPVREIAFRPSRVLLQDFTGVPAIVDLAAMRDAMKRLGGDPRKINPLQPVELVIDHSVQVDEAGTPRSFLINAELEFSAIRSGMRSSAGARMPSRISGWFLRTPGSCIRSISNIWRGWCSWATAAQAPCWPIRTPWWVRIPTPP